MNNRTTNALSHKNLLYKILFVHITYINLKEYFLVVEAIICRPANYLISRDFKSICTPNIFIITQLS